MTKRIFLFVLTNILVVATISITLELIQSFTGYRIDPSSYTGLLIFCSVFGFGGAFISLMISKWMAKRMTGLKIIDPVNPQPQARDVLNIVYAAARKAGLEKMPEVGIYDSPEVNAFATGPSRNNSLVAVSTGLMNRMNREELEGVLGHEVAHIANGDMVTMTLIQGVVNTFVMFFARIIASIISSNLDEKARGVAHFAIVIVLDIVLSLLGSMVVAYFSRAREFRADAGGARLTGKHKMIAALKRLQTQTGMIDESQEALATLKISNRHRGGLAALISTHPDLSVRIAALERASV
ncbi:MAG: protease HtpX [Pseudobdellovibrionaceae bacterium]